MAVAIPQKRWHIKDGNVSVWNSHGMEHPASSRTSSKVDLRAERSDTRRMAIVPLLSSFVECIQTNRGCFNLLNGALTKTSK